MAEFKSKYSGEEIEQILDKVQSIEVGVVDENFGNFNQANGFSFFSGNLNGGVGSDGQEFFQHVGHCLSQEGGNNGRRGLMTAQAVGVGGRGDARFQ